MTVKKHLLVFISLAAVIALCFFPSFSGGFTGWDDPEFLTRNPLVTSLSFDNLRRIFSEPVQQVYVPLSVLSCAVEYSFFGLNPFVYHLNNILLHIGTAFLIFLFFKKLDTEFRTAFLGALIFAIHPMHVESVSWITERKDVLYAFFYMLSLVFYLSSLEQKNTRQYLLSLLCGLLSILAKPMALSLPLIIILIDWMKSGRLRRKAFVAVVPFALLTAPVAAITYAYHARVPADIGWRSLGIMLWTFTFYIKQFFAPFILVPMYAVPENFSLLKPEMLTAVCVFLLSVALIARFWKNRMLIFAFFFFLFSIFFLVRFDIKVDKNVVADRFMYLPMTGFCLLTAQVIRRIKNVKWQGIAAVVILLFLGGKTMAQTTVWKNSLSLWNHILKHNPTEYSVYANRARFYIDQKQYDLALEDLNRSLYYNPRYNKALNNRGRIYQMRGQNDLARKDFLAAIRSNPRNGRAYNNLGLLYYYQGDYPSAMKALRRAIDLDIKDAEAYNNLGLVFDATDRGLQAFYAYSQAVTLDPDLAGGYNNRAFFYKAQKRFDRALADFNRAVALEPNRPEFYQNRGNCYAAIKEYDKARADYQKALALYPGKKQKDMIKALLLVIERSRLNE